MKPRYLLDTNACADYLRDRHGMRARLGREKQGRFCVSSIVSAELEFGAANSRHPAEHQQVLTTFFRRIPVIDFDAEAARAYGNVRATLEREGRRIGAMDMMIAAHAVSAGLVLVSDDADVDRIRGLSRENWRQ